MKKIVAIITGFALAVLCAAGGKSYIDGQITKNKSAVRNYRSYERFWSKDVQKMIIDDNTLPVFGSSELLSLEDYHENTFNFLNSSDMNILTIGAGSFQSLSHAMALGAISENISSKKIALFLSPQWFSESGVPQDAFPSRFGEDMLLGFLDNKSISDTNKAYVLERTLTLLSNSPAQYARVEKYKIAFENKLSVDKIYTDIMSMYWGIKAEYQVYKQMDSMEKKLPVVDLANMKFPDMLKLAEQQGEDNCTNNDFGIMDDYWNRYVKDIYEQGEVVDKKQVFNESIEYDDLQCFLNIAKELGIEVIMVSIPVNEKWYTFQGQLCDEYYQNIRDIAAEYENVTLVDMSEYGSEKYFHRDIMHLGWKGWTRINEALYKEFSK